MEMNLTRNIKRNEIEFTSQLSFYFFLLYYSIFTAEKMTILATLSLTLTTGSYFWPEVVC